MLRTHRLSLVVAGLVVTMVSIAAAVTFTSGASLPDVPDSVTAAAPWSGQDELPSVTTDDEAATEDEDVADEATEADEAPEKPQRTEAPKPVTKPSTKPSPSPTTPAPAPTTEAPQQPAPSPSPTPKKCLLPGILCVP